MSQITNFKSQYKYIEFEQNVLLSVSLLANILQLLYIIFLKFKYHENLTELSGYSVTLKKYYSCKHYMIFECFSTIREDRSRWITPPDGIYVADVHMRFLWSPPASILIFTPFTYIHINNILFWYFMLITTSLIFNFTT